MSGCATITLDELLLIFKQQLEEATTLTSFNCYIGLNPNQNMYQPDDQYCIITPGIQTISNNYVACTAESQLVYDGTIHVTLWSRLALDQTPRDDSYLTDSNYGALPAMNVIIDALHLFLPLDTSGNPQTMLPIKMQRFESYAKDFGPVCWGATKVSFRVLWRSSLTSNHIIS